MRLQIPHKTKCHVIMTPGLFCVHQLETAGRIQGSTGGIIQAR